MLRSPLQPTWDLTIYPLGSPASSLAYYSVSGSDTNCNSPSSPLTNIVLFGPKPERGEQYLLTVGLGCYKWYQRQTPNGVPTRTLGPQKGWIMRSHVNWREERSIAYKRVETSPYPTRFRNFEGKLKRKSSKRTISTSGGHGRLHHVCIKRVKPEIRKKVHQKFDKHGLQ